MSMYALYKESRIHGTFIAFCRIASANTNEKTFGGKEIPAEQAAGKTLLLDLYYLVAGVFDCLDEDIVRDFRLNDRALFL